MADYLEGLEFIEFDEGVDSIMPDGEYECVVYSAELRQGRKSPYIAMQLIVTSGEYEDEMLFQNIVLGGSRIAQRISKQNLHALLQRDIKSKEKTADIMKELLGKPIIAIVKKDVYQGVERPEVKGLKPWKKATDALFEDSGSEEGGTSKEELPF